MTLRIARLADHADAVSLLARGYDREWPEWYREPGQARQDLSARLNRSSLPLGLVALDAGAAVGTAALSADDTYGDPDFRPTLIGLWVAPEHRRRGIASA